MFSKTIRRYGTQQLRDIQTPEWGIRSSLARKTGLNTANLRTLKVERCNENIENGCNIHISVLIQLYLNNHLL